MLKSLDDIGRNCWASKVKSLLYTCGFGYVWLAQDIENIDIFILAFRQRLKDCFEQK
jgi:hypothetical protein